MKKDQEQEVAFDWARTELKQKESGEKKLRGE